MKTTKRLLSIVLALAMLLTMASFPAVAEESYTYTPKAIELEAAAGNFKWSEPKYIARPNDYNIYVGDYLALPEGGLDMVRSIQNIAAANSPTDAAVQPAGFAIDVFQSGWTSGSNVNKGIGARTNNGLESTTADGKERFYFAIDYTLSTNGTITGIYNTMADMVSGDSSKAIKGITLNAEGLWAVGLAHAVYWDGTNAPTLRIYKNIDSNNAQSYDSPDAVSNPYMFTFEVKETPTSKPVEVSAPEVPAGITADDIKSAANFVFDPSAEDFSTSNSIYARSYSKDANGKVFAKNKQIINISGTVPASLSGFAIDLLAPAYIKDLTITSADTFGYDYYVYGSMDGENWYEISDGYRSTTKTTSHKLVVEGIAKYFHIDTRGYTGTYHTSYGQWKTPTLSSINGVLNVYEGNTVTVSGDYNAELYTDANGKAGFDFINYPAGKEEGKYIYKIGDVDVTDTIADYVFTADTTVTVTKYVKPIGHLVTFTDGTTTKEVYADEDGYYEVPEIFKGNFSFYADSYYAIKLDVTAPVNEATTVYVKAEPWSYIPKTVEFGIKNVAINSTSFGNSTNGPVIAPRETIYVGDTMVLPVEAYKDCVLWTAGTGGELTALDMSLWRLASTEEDEGFVYNLGKMTDVKFTFKEPGIYSLHTNWVYGVKADGTLYEKDYTVAKPNGCFNCVIEVLPKPTSAPTSTIAPEYTGDADTPVALLDSNFDTSVAFKKSYGKDLGYYKGGEGNSVVALNAEMGSPLDETQRHPISQTQYIQFNLPSLSYVTNVSITTNEVIIYDYDAYGSMDGENWYLLNSGIVNNKKYTVNGVANYVRIVVRSTDGWEAEKSLLTAYKVNGYAIDVAEVTTPAPSWVKADGTKTTITSTKSLPVAYTDGTTNYAITGWKVETGNGFAKVALADIAKKDVEEIGDVYAVVEEIPFDADALMATLEEQNGDANGTPFTAENYINGFYVQGAQIRVTNGANSGLRFINVIDNNLITALKDLKQADTIKGYDYGTVVVASTQYTGGDLVIDYVQKNGNIAKQVEGVKTFAKADDFNGAYFKYTVCVTGIAPENYTKEVIVRPYLTITVDEDSTITLYGEQYSASVYGAALLGVNNEEGENKAALLEIIETVEGAQG